MIKTPEHRRPRIIPKRWECVIDVKKKNTEKAYVRDSRPITERALEMSLDDLEKAQEGKDTVQEALRVTLGEDLEELREDAHASKRRH